MKRAKVLFKLVLLTLFLNTDHCQLYGQFFAGQAGIRQEGIENLYGLPR